MKAASLSADERFAALTKAFAGQPGVEPPGAGKGFGSAALRVHGKIFAMLVEGKLVLKLPKARVQSMTAAGQGEYFEPRHDGRQMKEWIVLAATSQEEWRKLAREALAFVDSKS